MHYVENYFRKLHNLKATWKESGYTNTVSCAKILLLKTKICSWMIDILVKTLNVMGILCWVMHDLQNTAPS